MKYTILHIIESLGIGGAEILLTESLKDINNDDYRHIVVYMRSPNTLLPEVKADKVYCLKYKGKRNILMCILKLRKIILKEQVDLIHAHHYWPTIVARLAKPQKLPFLFTVHNPLSNDAFSLNFLSLYLEKLTYKSSHHAIFVSDTVKSDYQKFIRLKLKHTVLYNFVTDAFFNQHIQTTTDRSKTGFKLVAVGTLKAQKNYFFLLQVMEKLKNENIHLDIIGDGPLKAEIEIFIKDKGLQKVKLLGKQQQLHTLIHAYDAFILSSTYEGMSLAVIEAMATGLPCILSNIESNEEATGGHAVLIDLADPEQWKTVVLELIQNIEKRKHLSLLGKRHAMNFKKQNYLSKLEALYAISLTQ